MYVRRSLQKFSVGGVFIDSDDFGTLVLFCYSFFSLMSGEVNTFINVFKSNFIIVYLELIQIYTT